MTAKTIEIAGMACISSAFSAFINFLFMLSSCAAGWNPAYARCADSMPPWWALAWMLGSVAALAGVMLVAGWLSILKK